MSSLPEPSSQASIQSIGEAPMLELVRHISDDLTTIVQDVVALGRLEITRDLRATLADVGGIVLGGVVALIALGLLCTGVVVLLEPLIPSLALRMFLMAGVYALVGIAVSAGFIKRMKGDAVGTPLARREVSETLNTIREKVRHG